ncbi:hypothetical protein [uncultured Ilyobacter sp.]|uniref:hypothetical protein n=1 Tax=uncultured Ilyobacter sp. TaxID=544433 RepID=UPI0029C04A4D|nr:hypothetical protein [uncultured Ilyobacter sp.]
MIEYIQRSLNDDDIKYINKKYKFQEKRLIFINEKVMKYLPFYSALFGICAVVFFILLYKRSDNFFLFLTGTIFIFSPFVIFRLVKTFIKNTMLQTKLHQIVDSILEKDTAKVVRCISSKMMEFEEVEDEGAQYLFQVEENKIFHISGQEFYETSFFPSSDFELVTIMGPGEENALDFHIHCSGHKLSPILTVPREVKKEYIDKISEFPEVIEGNIENLDSVMNIILK